MSKHVSKKVIGGVVATGVLASALLGGAVGYGIAPEKVQVIERPVIVENKTIEVVEVPVEVPVNNTVEVVKEVEAEGFDETLDVLVDQPDVDLFDDLDDDEVTTEEIADRAAFIIEAYNMAVNAVEKEGVGELDKEKVGDVRLDEDDIEFFSVDDDFDELEFDNIDFDDKDVDVYVTADFEHDDKDDFEATFRVRIRDGEVDEVSVVDVQED